MAVIWITLFCSIDAPIMNAADGKQEVTQLACADKLNSRMGNCRVAPRLNHRQKFSFCNRWRIRSAPHAVLAGVDGGAGFAVGLAAAFGLALVPVLFALGHGQFALHPPVAEVKPGGDERVTLDLRLRE
jgi:hypothetical protein